jgi:HTH-type transcriptional regulator/antitoxin HigA
MRNIRSLHSEAEYDWALVEIERYFDKEPKRGTAEADRFDVLAALIESYEAQRWPIGLPLPVAKK